LEQGKTPVVATGRGGLEVATFNEGAGQVYHKHLLATEVYTVLEGTMRMRLEDEELTLEAGDEVIVFPNAAHEILPQGTHFLARAHVINCHGERDKYVSINGEWCQLYTLKKLGLGKGY
jgi:quercetin dioxygenase-like cupin family protein